MSIRDRRTVQAGVSLVELIVFIVIVSIAVAGVLVALDRSARNSADPLIIKQALAIAEALLDEVELAPFTYCDPDDPNARTAAGTGSCTTTEPIVPTGGAAQGESRYSVPLFDNVADYNGFCMGVGCSPPVAGIRDITNTAIGGLNAYSASVAVAAAALGSIAAGSGDALRITVTVTGPANTVVVLSGYRTRYAPNAIP